MWIALVASLALAPQEPVAPASTQEVLAQIHAGQDVGKEVAARAADLAKSGLGKLKGASRQQAAEALWKAGVGGLDQAREQSAGLAGVGQGGPITPTALMDQVAAGWSRRVPDVKSKSLDIDQFEKLCERVFRDIKGAVGSGRDTGSTAAQFSTVIEQARLAAAAGGWDKPTRGLVKERFERVAKVDQEELLVLARRLLAGAMTLRDDKLLRTMQRREPGQPRDNVKGEVFEDRETPFGRMVVGGFGKNEYDCTQIDVIIDFGGDDIYRGPAGGTGDLRRLAVVVDLSGNDRYQALNAAFGSGTYGIGLLLDCAGDDVYRGGDRCLGYGAAGVGMWFDLDGKDDIEIGSLGGGFGLAGIGLAADLGAAADLHKATGTEAFGCGLTGGLGLFFDEGGDDQRQLGLAVVSMHGRDETLSQGFGYGSGVAPELAGGLGVFLDLAGVDKYSAAGAAFGVGARGGLGVFRDFGGADTYQAGFAALGAAFDTGFGAFIDDAGDDIYAATALACGAAIGHSAAWFLDEAGDDGYSTAGSALGSARRASIAGFLDRGGKDKYHQTDAKLEWPAGGTDRNPDSIAVFLDEGGEPDVFEEAVVRVTAGTRMVDLDRTEGVERRILVDR